MKIDAISEKIILSSLAVSVAFSAPYSIDASKLAIKTLSERSKADFSRFKVFTSQETYQSELAKGKNQEHAMIRNVQKLKKLQISPIENSKLSANLFLNHNMEEIAVSDHVLVKIKAGKLFRLGEKSDAVKALQAMLAVTGYYHFSQDGIFGEKTKQATMTYQKENGLTIDGVIGEQTYNHLAGISASTVENQQEVNNLLAEVYIGTISADFLTPPVITSPAKQLIKNDLHEVSLLQAGDSGQAVKDLQSLLKQRNYYDGKIDGIYGQMTETAIRSYQADNYLQVDGIAGRRTITHLKAPASLQASARSQATVASSTTINTTIQGDASIIAHGKTLIGTPYIWGGTTPSGFDCSGFLMYLYKKAGKKIPRTVADIWNLAKPVDHLQKGDIVFFQTYKKGPSHAGIYLGNDQFLHAGVSTGVTISDLTMNYWSSRYLGAKRLY